MWRNADMALMEVAKMEEKNHEMTCFKFAKKVKH